MAKSNGLNAGELVVASYYDKEKKIISQRKDPVETYVNNFSHVADFISNKESAIFTFAQGIRQKALAYKRELETTIEKKKTVRSE